MSIHVECENVYKKTTAIEKNKNISQIDKENIKKFMDECFAVGIGKVRVCSYLNKLKCLAEKAKKPLSQWNKEDVKEAIANIEQKDWSEWTKKGYKLTIRKFFQVLEGYEWNSNKYPDKVNWISMRIKSSKLKTTNSTDILTDEDIVKLVNVATNYRDKSFLSTLFESGCRIGELLPLKIDAVTFQKIESENRVATVCVINVTGKTGPREIMLVASVPLLKRWLDIHPNKDDSSPLWVSLGNKNHHKMASYDSMRMMLKKLAKKTGLKKPVNPHSFRKSSATKFSSFLADQQLKMRYGWVKDSKMLATYTFIKNESVNNSVLNFFGIKNSDQKNNEIKIRVCPVCDFENSFEKEYCLKCSTPLTLEAQKKMEEGRQKREEELYNKFAPSEQKIEEIFNHMAEQKFQQMMEKFISSNKLDSKLASNKIA